MPNLFKFADWVTADCLRILQNKSQVSQFFNTDQNKEYTKEFAVGETINVKLPQRFLIRDGMAYTPQPINRRTTPVTMDQTFGVDFEWDSVEQALKMERSEAEIREQYIKPAAAQIAQELDSRCAFYAYQNCPNIVGALHTNPTAVSTYMGARQLLNEMSCPEGERGMIISPSMESSLTGSTTIAAYMNPTSEISRQYREGSMGRMAGFDWYSSNALYDHTAGTWANTLTVQTTPTEGATSVVVGGTITETLVKGDVFCFSASYAVNPGTRRSVGHLKTFVVTQTFTATGGTADTLYFYPPIYGPGSQYQNVDAYPVGASATITNFPGTTTPGTGPLHGIQGLALHKDAFMLVSTKLALPKAVEIASQTRDPETGVSVRFIRSFDAEASKMINRFDVLIGFGCGYPESCSVRVLSAT